MLKAGLGVSLGCVAGAAAVACIFVVLVIFLLEALIPAAEDEVVDLVIGDRVS